ncbi:hypothetical protein RhiirA1_486795 [Rhizophagus irregularis]|uniref:Uncharacterized protein n=1 Tax=Rhizophagus irregularis TaxID=588596 RepID=A0A2N0QGX4_9GLOM|nr:hypothetical protein RhiirA1_486795 [Rhizophagus irregularis]
MNIFDSRFLLSYYIAVLSFFLSLFTDLMVLKIGSGEDKSGENKLNKNRNKENS